MNPAPWALLLVSILWGTTFVAVKSGLSDASPLLFVGVRFGVATLATLPLLRTGRPDGAALRAGIPLGAVLALGYAAQTLGLEITTPSRSAFVTGLNVALVPLWGWAVLRSRAGRRSIAGLALAIPGLWLFTSPAGGAWNRGDTWTIACAVFFALHVILIHKYGRKHDAARLLVSQLGVTAVLCLVAAPALEDVRFVVSWRLSGAIFLTAILATVGTTWLQLRYQPRVDPTRAGLIYVTEPLFATLFSWMFTGETLPAVAWGGAALILIGMVLAGMDSDAEMDPAGSPLAEPDRKLSEGA